MFPLRIESRERFATLRSLLKAAQYEEAEIFGRLGLKTFDGFRSIRQGRPAEGLSDALDVLVRLFMDAERVDRDVVRTLLAARDLDTLRTFNLLQDEGGACQSTVLLYPVGSHYIASDRPAAADGKPEEADIVYSALNESTRRFLAALPSTPCENFLELCAGTGIAALRAARQAGQAWAVDISARATLFARFNGLLNQIENFTAVQGDLFEAVADQTFDRICAHPPYMPAVVPKYLYRDGGGDGEEVTRRIIVDLPSYLRPGGRFYCYCLASDRRSQAVEQRVREMLGSAAPEFDVAVVALAAMRPSEYFAALLASRDVTPAQAQEHLTEFERLAVGRIVACWIVVQRTGRSRRVFTVRRQAGEATGSDEIEWLLGQQTATLDPPSAGWLWDAKPLVSPGAQLQIAHRLGDKGWAPAEHALHTDTPFLLTARCPPWTEIFLAHCDGGTTVREHRAALQDRGVTPGQLSDDVFLALVRALLAGGFIYIEGQLQPPTRHHTSAESSAKASS